MFLNRYDEIKSLKSLLDLDKASIVPIPVISATDSGGSRPPVPLEAGHLIRSKAAGNRSEATLVFI